jgi:mRNA interferase MazF
MTHIKKFDDWIEDKKHINQKTKLVTFKKGDIWWASIGVNIGSEIDGKNSEFERPVLIIKKITKTQAFSSH